MTTAEVAMSDRIALKFTLYFDNNHRFVIASGNRTWRTTEGPGLEGIQKLQKILSEKYSDPIGVRSVHEGDMYGMRAKWVGENGSVEMIWLISVHGLTSITLAWHVGQDTILPD